MATQRPVAVTAIGVITILLAIASIAASLFTVFLASLFIEGSQLAVFTAVVGGIAAIVIILGVVVLYGAVSLLHMKRRGWIIVEVIGIITAIMNIASLQATSVIMGIVWLVVVAYLYNKRALFK